MGKLLRAFRTPRIESPLLAVFGRWFLPVALGACLIANCAIVARKRLTWADELFTYYPACAPFGRMLASTTDTINSSPPLYFITAWFWGRFFGSSPLALRLLSAAAVAAAIVFMFMALRRAYGVLAAAAALGLSLVFSDWNLQYQSTSARPHALIVGEVALAILLYQRMTQRRPSNALLAGNALVHAGIVMTHYFGLLYSGAILLGVVLTGIIRRSSPLRAGLSIVCGWLVFIPWIPVFRRHEEMGRPTFWIPVPTAAALRGYYAHYIGGDFWILAKGLALSLLAGAALAVAHRRGLRRTLTWLFSFRRREVPLLLLLPGFGLVPLLVYYLSTRRGAPSVFWEFYMLSGALGWAIVCAHLAHRALRLGTLAARGPLRRLFAGLQAVIVAAMLGWGGWVLLRHACRAEREDPPADAPASDPHNEPVVVEHIFEFMKFVYYSPHPERYVFALDPEVGMAAGGGGPLNEQIMAALRRQFPDHFQGVVPTGRFLAGASGFWVKRFNSVWWSMRVESNPAFVTDRTLPGENLVHVRRRRFSASVDK